MPYEIPLRQAKSLFPAYDFVKALTPSAHKAAFHVQNSSGEDLCLKMISPEFGLDRLEREVNALLEVDHPNIVGFREYTFSVTRETQRHYIIEDYIAGDDLSAHLGEPWEGERTILFFIDFFSGLSALEAHKIVHRDLKPSNIRVRSSDTSPVIIDLGLARHLELSSLTTTSDGAAIGTPAYFSPEQFQGTKHDIDHRTDLFAAGILMYEAAVGSHPFLSPGVGPDKLKERVCGDYSSHLKSSRFKHLPDGLRLLITRLLERPRARRPSSASQVVDILASIA